MTKSQLTQTNKEGLLKIAEERAIEVPENIDDITKAELVELILATEGVSSPEVFPKEGTETANSSDLTTTHETEFPGVEEEAFGPHQALGKKNLDEVKIYRQGIVEGINIAPSVQARERLELMLEVLDTTLEKLDIVLE